MEHQCESVSSQIILLLQVIKEKKKSILMGAITSVFQLDFNLFYKKKNTLVEIIGVLKKSKIRILQ